MRIPITELLVEKLLRVSIDRCIQDLKDVRQIRRRLNTNTMIIFNDLQHSVSLLPLEHVINEKRFMILR